jgi:RNA polymerase sigma-70 factor (ECF subfamily)
VELKAAIARSDARLLREIAADCDPRAEQELCRRYQLRVYRYGLRHLGDADSAWDLTQDVLGLLLEKTRQGEVREPSRLGSFVMGSCRFLTANRTRAEKRRKWLLARYPDPVEPTVDPVTDGRDLERLARFWSTLPERERRVLWLSFWAELEASAIASELGTNPGHVRVLRHRALARLQARVLGA